MEAFLHQVLAGLATGGIYASLALALVMIYQATHLVNFAQGEMAMFATYFAWSLIDAGMPYWPAFLLTVVFAFVLGVLPLVLASGPGWELRQALGTAVFFGMIGVTVFGLIFTPAFYVACRSLGERLKRGRQRPNDEQLALLPAE